MLDIPLHKSFDDCNDFMSKLIVEWNKSKRENIIGHGVTC